MLYPAQKRQAEPPVGLADLGCLQPRSNFAPLVLHTHTQWGASIQHLDDEGVAVPIFQARSKVKVLVNTIMGRVRRKGSAKGIERQAGYVHCVDCLEVGRRWLDIVAKVGVAVGVVIATSGLDAERVERAWPHGVLVLKVMGARNRRLGRE